VIPLHDDSRRRRLPVMTLALIGLNAAVFAAELLLLPRHGLSRGGFYARAGVTPYELTHHVDVGPRDLVPWWLTMFSALFVHGGWLHIIFNMLFLWVFGPGVEDAMTRARFLAFYLLCGLAATTAQVVADPASTAPLIGASGAIAGVLGAYLVLLPRARVLAVIPLIIVFPVVSIPAWMLLLAWFALQAVQGLGSLHAATPGVAFFAHIGGFLAGMALVLPFVVRRPRRRVAARLR
jgi:membrane associated rhomboid family serine protease